MIYGIGVDCVQVDRVAHGMARPHFAERVFSEEERELINALSEKSEKRGLETAGACFAAKEALLKAAGIGLGGFPLADIAALRRESGQPYYRLSGVAAKFCEERGLETHLSITHEAGLAVAFAMLVYKQPPGPAQGTP